MLTLKDYVNWGITHSDKTGSAEGVPLVMENCVKNKKMKQFEVYGSDLGVGDSENGKYKIPVTVRGKNIYDAQNYPLTDGVYINAPNGSVAGGSNATLCGTQGYIPCAYISGKTITLSPTSGHGSGIAFYDENKKYISGVANLSSTKGYITATVPDNAVYCRISSVITKKEYTQIEFGSVATEFEPYTEPITTNVYLNEPLGSGDVLNFKDKKVSNGYGFKESVECDLPTLIAKTSIVEIGTTVAPSNMKGKYIKR